MYTSSLGPEYDILPMMSVGAEFDRNGIAACQINVEIHHSKPNFKARLVTILKQYLHDRRYVFVLARHIAGHHRTFLLNFEDRRCVQKYISQFFIQ
ncbi:hypothetical protein OESDEN_10121 [Oesophagostomum dentatum]|uniref:Uncharacterized protein n=1 Tax=Oesophagostomum dentatum TaxID=61180 RepID=A0A0B1T2N2_OESDE|nr:hypothetical protein OESDEN_10121 [Oesophagostomum dentatum]